MKNVTRFLVVVFLHPVQTLQKIVNLVFDLSKLSLNSLKVICFH